MRNRSTFTRSTWLVALAITAASVFPAAQAEAGPILVATFAGFIPTLTVTQSLQNFAGPSPADTVTTFSNVPFTGVIRLDAAKLALATASGGFPFRQFNDPDPWNASPGPDTAEWMRGEVTLGGGLGTTLAFNRDFVNGASATGMNTWYPFDGYQSIAYIEGSEAIASLGFELGDAFFPYVSNNFGYFVTGPVSPGDLVSFGEFSLLNFFIQTGVTPTFDVVDLFGPGPPFSFLWEDSTPAICAVVFPCGEYYTVQGGLSHFSYATTYTGDPAIGGHYIEGLGYQGDLVLTRVELAPDVPEPAMLLLIASGVAAALRARRRR